MGSNTSPPLGHFSMQQLHQLSLEYLSMPVGLCQSSICWTYCNPALKRHLQDQDDLAGSLGLSAEVWQQVWRCITRHRQYHALNLVLPALLAQYVLVSRRLDDAGETPSYFIEFQNKSNIFQQVWQYSLGANLQQQQQRQALKMAQQMHSALHLSNTDSLTDIANRRAFDQHFAQLWQQTTSIEEPLSLMLIDIDFFKDINDCLGHDHGDWVLHEVAQCLAYGINRSQDLVARIGGEEFAVILPHTNFEGLQIVAQHLLQRIRTLDLPHPTAKAAPMVTVSIGGCTLHQRLAHHSPNLLLRCADQALYQAKQHGRNQACCVALSDQLT